MILHIFNCFFTTFLTKVHVYIRHVHTFGIQKSFKHQIKTHGINIGNHQTPCHNRASPRTTPWPHRYTVVFGPLNKIGHNQKVTRETHLFNHAQFKQHLIVIFLLFFGRSALHTDFKTFFGHIRQNFIFRFTLAIKIRESRLFLFGHKGTPAGNQNRIGQSLRQIRKQFAHLIFGF